VLRIDPSDAGTKVNLAQMYLQQRDIAQALVLFKEALAAEPYNVTAAYGLATALLRGGQAAEGGDAMKRFQSLRDSAYGVTYGTNYLQQGRYAEASVSTGAEAGLVDERTPQVVFTPRRTCSGARTPVSRCSTADPVSICSPSRRTRCGCGMTKPGGSRT
jgi:predicted Zn-dependent protease